MQEAVPIGKGAMAALIGTNIETAKKITDKVNSYGICDIANDNSQGQVVISGDTISHVEYAMKLSKNLGIKKSAVILPSKCSISLSIDETCSNNYGRSS